VYGSLRYCLSTTSPSSASSSRHRWHPRILQTGRIRTSFVWR